MTVVVTSRKKTAKPDRLPAHMRAFFWDHDPARLTWKRDGDLIVARLLAVGDWTAIQWVRARLGDNGLRDWLLSRRGAGLSPRQLRFWELILNLPRRQVNAWLANPSRKGWDQRRNP
jgi:hypothetical protein